MHTIHACTRIESRHEKESTYAANVYGNILRATVIEEIIAEHTQPADWKRKQRFILRQHIPLTRMNQMLSVRIKGKYRSVMQPSGCV